MSTRCSTIPRIFLMFPFLRVFKFLIIFRVFSPQTRARAQNVENDGWSCLSYKHICTTLETALQDVRLLVRNVHSQSSQKFVLYALLNLKQITLSRSAFLTIYDSCIRLYVNSLRTISNGLPYDSEMAILCLKNYESTNINVGSITCGRKIPDSRII